jgi:hypothetical protein
MTTLTFPPEFLMYIPGRKVSAADPFNSLLLMKAAPSHMGQLLHVDPSGNAATVHLTLPTVNPLYKTRRFPAEICLPNGLKSYHTVTVLTHYLKAVKNGSATTLEIYSIAKLKDIFPGPILRRNVHITSSGLTNEQLAQFNFPLPVGPLYQAVAVATTVDASGSSVTAVTAPPKKKISYGHPGINAYVARQLMEFAQMKGEVCPITAGYFEEKDTAVMPCGHLFSKLAIDETFKKEPGKCPACRTAGAPIIV